MKRFVCVIILTIGVSFLSAAQTTEIKHKRYIKQFIDFALVEEKISGVPASITLAQGILESNSGESFLAKEAYNHFGIKCKKTYEGKVIFHDDDQKNDCFRVYESVLDSYKDHSNFLRRNKRYAFLFDYKKSNYKAWAKGLKKAGYATDKKYADRLIAIIEKNKLDELNQYNGSEDFLAYIGTVSTKPKGWQDPVVTNTEKQIQKPKKETPQPKDDILIAVETVKKEKEAKKENIVEIKPFIPVQKLEEKYYQRFLHKNGSTFILTVEGDNFETISKRHDVWTSELKRYNEVTISPVYGQNEFVYVRPKKRKAHIKYYYVKENDTIYNIAQKFGIWIKRIRKMNDIEPGEGINPGMRIRLR